MAKGYHHLTYSQRCQIVILKERGESNSAIAKYLGVHRSTVYRELARNSKNEGYDYDQAHKEAEGRRKKDQTKRKKNRIFL